MVAWEKRVFTEQFLASPRMEIAKRSRHGGSAAASAFEDHPIRAFATYLQGDILNLGKISRCKHQSCIALWHWWNGLSHRQVSAFDSDGFASRVGGCHPGGEFSKLDGANSCAGKKADFELRDAPSLQAILTNHLSSAPGQGAPCLASVREVSEDTGKQIS